MCACKAYEEVIIDKRKKNRVQKGPFGEKKTNKQRSVVVDGTFRRF